MVVQVALDVLVFVSLLALAVLGFFRSGFG